MNQSVCKKNVFTPAVQFFGLQIYSLIIILMGFSNPGLAADQMSPDRILEQATREMVAALQTHRSEIVADNTRLYPLIEDILLPHLDIITTSRLVLGKYWQDASKQQKLQFIREFRNLMIRFYGTALGEYLGEHEIKNEMIRFMPLNESLDKNEITVHSEVIPPSGDKVAVYYRMQNTRNGWKVFDVTVSGVSLITTYRTSFAVEIKQKGLDGLISSLASRSDNILKANRQKTSLAQSKQVSEQ
ncbi:MAG: ABC transporter substrate-binding protein [Gammaproteobacteria bacterium]|nr:ABC transporter substrate-binding protein [Gammaproteobacteria bacterium]